MLFLILSVKERESLSILIKSSDRTAADVIDKVFNPETSQKLKTKTTVSTSVIESQDEVETSNDKESLEYFKWAKSEMQRLGFDTMEDFEEYQDYIERKKQRRAQRNSDFSMWNIYTPLR